MTDFTTDDINAYIKQNKEDLSRQDVLNKGTKAIKRETKKVEAEYKLFDLAIEARPTQDYIL